MIEKGHKKTVLQNKPCLLKQRAIGTKVPLALSLGSSGKGAGEPYDRFFSFLFPAGKIMITEADPDFLIKI